jgi:Zn-dependent M28 family amino/carboxypeptidase
MHRPFSGARRALGFGMVIIVAAACGEKGTSSGGGTASGARAQTTAFNGESALGYVRQVMAFGPRVPGTAAHDSAGDWIVAQMRQRADTVIVQEWRHKTASGEVLPMRNVLARFRPEASERVLYLTHWDTRPVSESAEDPAQRDTPVPGANDGGSGVGLFLALADALKRTPPTVGVDLLFVDGEDYGDFDKQQDVFIGSTYFADHLPSADYRPLFGVLWDMIGDRDLQIYYELNSFEQAPEVVARVWRVAEELGYGRYFIPQGKYRVNDDHIPLLAKGLRVIDVIDFDYGSESHTYHHTPEDTIDKLSAGSLKVVGDVAVRLVTE